MITCIPYCFFSHSRRLQSIILCWTLAVEMSNWQLHVSFVELYNIKTSTLICLLDVKEVYQSKPVSKGFLLFSYISKYMLWCHCRLCLVAVHLNMKIYSNALRQKFQWKEQKNKAICQKTNNRTIPNLSHKTAPSCTVLKIGRFPLPKISIHPLYWRYYKCMS